MRQVGSLAAPEARLPVQYLDPCAWGNALRLVVGRGSRYTGDVVLDQGIQVSVLVRDARGALSREGARLPLLSLVSERGEPRGLLQPRVSRDGLVRFSGVVPLGVYRLSVEPNGVLLRAGKQGLAVQARTILDPAPAVRAAMNADAKEIVFGELEVVE